MLLLIYKTKQMLHKKRIQDLIDLTKTTDTGYFLHQLELLQLEIERDIIQTKYDTIDECYERINKK